jgi:hypothetical protein
MTHSRRYQWVYFMFWLISSLCESHAVAVQRDGHGKAITNTMAQLIRRQTNKRAKSHLKAGNVVGEVSADGHAVAVQEDGHGKAITNTMAQLIRRQTNKRAKSQLKAGNIAGEVSADGKVKIDAMLKAAAEAAPAEVDADANRQFIAQAEKGNEGAARRRSRRRESRRRRSRRRQGISPDQTWKSLIQAVTKTARCNQRVQNKASDITLDGPEIQITYERGRCTGHQPHRRRFDRRRTKAEDETYKCVRKQAISWDHRRRKDAPSWISEESHGLNPVCDSIGYVNGDNKLLACLHPSIDTDPGNPSKLEVTRQGNDPDPGNHKLCSCLDHFLSDWSDNIGFDDIKSKVCSCQGLCEDFKTEELGCDPSPQCNPPSMLDRASTDTRKKIQFLDDQDRSVEKSVVHISQLNEEVDADADALVELDASVRGKCTR